MGQDKKQLTKLLKYVKELYDNPDNKEFAAGIQALVDSTSKHLADDTYKIDEIYELCLEKNAKEQAVGLYDGFPIPDIVDTLVEDYVIMERFRRRGDFINYAAHLFLQIENICNEICTDNQYDEIYSCLLNANILAFIDNNGKIENRYSDPKHTTASKVIFGDYDKTDKGVPKKDLSPSILSMYDRMKISLYFAGFGTQMKYSSYGEWIYNTNLLYDIYLIRCKADHRGGQLTENQKNRLNKLLPQKNRYYSLFFSELIYFVNKIMEGISQKNDLVRYAKSFEKRIEESVVTSVLPSTLFVKNGAGQVYQIPISICKTTALYSVGQTIKVYFNSKGSLMGIEA